MVLISLVALLPHCAPTIDPDTALRLIQAESGARQFAININGPFRLSRQPASYHEFLQVVQTLDAGGYNFDFGFAQANNREVKRRGHTVSDVAQPCNNLRFMQQVLGDCYRQVPATFNNPQDRLANALSCYKTGRYGPGFRNGYVYRVWRANPSKAQQATVQVPPAHLPSQLKEKTS